MVEEIDDQAFDMRTIMILISHNHDAAIPQCIDIFIPLTNLNAQNLDKILNFRVGHDLRVAGVPHIEKLTS